MIAREGHLDFDALTERIHPADSRVRMLAQKTPASFVAFDLLALDDSSLLEVPLSDRRALLERAMSGVSRPCTWRRRRRTGPWRSSGSGSTRALAWTE